MITLGFVLGIIGVIITAIAGHVKEKEADKRMTKIIDEKIKERMAKK